MEINTWIEVNRKLVKELVFENQTEAAEFVLKVAKLSDERNHHADIELYQWKKVRLSICTHDAGNVITEKDRNWTVKVDQLLID